MKAKKHQHTDFCLYYVDNDKKNRYNNNFSYFLLLILILLQFGGVDHYRKKDKGLKEPIIDNSIIFIITFYFLTCSICNTQ